MAITDLTGYTWTGNSTLEDLDDYSIFIDFVCDGVAYSHINIRYLNGDIVEYGGTRVYQNNAWVDEKYRTITFTSNNSSWINWFESEGVLTKNVAKPTKKFTKLFLGDVVKTIGSRVFRKLSTEEPITELTDLAGTTWNIPSGFIAPSGYGVFDVNYVAYIANNELDSTQLAIGYSYNFDSGLSPRENFVSILPQYGGLSNSGSFTVTFTGGTDATNTSLITWLETNGELTSHTMPTQ